MIDIESQVFTAVKNVLQTAYPCAWITSEYVRTPPQFPAVMLVESINVPYRRSQDSSHQEVHADIMYELDVYSNKSTGKKRECKAILAVVDSVMADLGFTRTFCSPITNIYDPSIYRMTGRYTAIVSQDETIYRRT